MIDSTTVKMPELQVFGKTLVLGALLVELAKISYIAGGSLSSVLSDRHNLAWLLGIGGCVCLVIWYLFIRGFGTTAKRVMRSRRIDLLAIFILGGSATMIPVPIVTEAHAHIGKIDGHWILLLLAFVFLVIASPLIRALTMWRKERPPQMYFLTDDEVTNDANDVLASRESAVEFAKGVLASGSSNGLIYGVDGPWGVGKTSFLNFACNYWRQEASNQVIIVRFEPLRYASDPDLADRLIRELTAEIQSQVYVPEFRPAANRYSRMLKGKADFSFLGFSFSLEPSPETVDELLDDIDIVLERNSLRLVVVVDDLDRLDAKAVNDVLFMVRRTFRLKQAAYVLCYDTENLVESNDDGERARQFLEKFVNIKLSLFVDSASLRSFLRTDWNRNGSQFPSIPADTMLKLEAVLSELAVMLEDENAATYMRLIGDLRKLKRFVNAVLQMRLERTNLARTDFNLRDLINLMLLHLNYPGIFRRIYVEETEGRSGFFSLKTERMNQRTVHVNSPGFLEYTQTNGELGEFLLRQLFEVDTLDLGEYGSIDESVLVARACFNSTPHRNLEAFLLLIVRFAAPEPRETFRLYQDAVTRVANGNPISDVLSDAEFSLADGNHAHDEFWRILVSQSHSFDTATAQQSIETLVEMIPRYSLVNLEDRGLRGRSIYNLIRLLDRAGWRRTDAQRADNTPENIVEIAHRIYGEGSYLGQGLIDRLAGHSRGVLGVYDLLLFRLQCSADRQGQVQNLHAALIVYNDLTAPTTGNLNALTVSGMRTITQRVFAKFRVRYIIPSVNLFDEFDTLTHADLLGESLPYYITSFTHQGQMDRLENSVEATRSLAKSFVVYQLLNRHAPTGSGVGCGFYDSTGDADQGEIAYLMNQYLFEVCFNPNIAPENAEHFLNYCLLSLSSDNWAHGNERYQPSVQGMTSVMDPHELARYWDVHGHWFRSQNYPAITKKVISLNYVASYAEDIPLVYAVLDQVQAQFLVVVP
ncbi:P-loop NTPase fold protein [Janthinobacterium sp. GMG2]|uniref:P-loop NTPase fold protein n=1 Tax=Janthinobacterium sp. GMG2 TaxID=3096606 RepID=UPI0029F5A58A|nr:P-loop NTPase fold protein [Janthinobacterium sp. GMG2]MDX8123098.1 P-loop NTPase fold protein [Janthinobacterium sp. GMG2]